MPTDPNPGAPDFDVFHLDLGLELRGGQRQVLYLAESQFQAGFCVHIVAPSGSPITERACSLSLPVLPLPGKRDFSPGNLRALLRVLSPTSILHTHDARAASLGALVRLARPVRLVHTRRVSYALGRGWGRWKYRFADMTVCVSREVERVMARSGVSRTRVIPSAIRLSRYARRQNANGGRIGIIGALSPQKGHAQFFSALAKLASCPEVWIVGRGALEDALRAQAEELGIASHLVWKGEVESPEVLPHLDILATPSAHGEGSSGVIKEGWAAGVPVVCSDLDANLELVRDGENGLVFHNGDSSDLARQLTRLAGDARLAEVLIQTGLQDARAYDVAAMHQSYRDVYAALRR